MWTANFQMFNWIYKRQRKQRSNCQHPLDHQKSKRVTEKHLHLFFTAYAKASDCWITTNSGEFFKRWEYQTTWPASWDICMKFKKQQLELDMEQQTGSKLGKEYVKPVYCHHAYLTYMQSTSWETWGWMKQMLESRLLGEISITSDMQMTLPYGRKWRRTKKPLAESEKIGLKLKIQKTKIMASGPITAWQIDGEQWQTLFCGAPKSLQMVIAAMKLKDACSLEVKLWPS